MTSLDFVSKLEGLLAKKKKVLVYHRDVDGICSAGLFLKFFPDFRTEFKQDPKLDDEFLKRLVEEKPEVILFVDLNVDQYWEKMTYLKKMLRETEIVVIDHHVVQKDLNGFDIEHINPRLEKPEIYIPTSRLVFDILKKIKPEAENFRWLACTGVIGDHGLGDNKDFLEETRKKHPGLLGKDVMESKLFEFSKLIYSGIVLKGKYGTRRALEIVTEAKKPEDLENTKLVGWKREVDREIEKVLKEGKTEGHGKVMVFTFKSKLNLTSILSNILVERRPGKVLVVAKEVEGGVKVSLRAPEVPIDLSEIVREVVKGIGHGGGHEKAAGAFVKDFEEFKKRVLELVG